MIQMKITGAKELQRKFEQIKLDMAEAYAVALIASANPVVNTTKRNTPIKTGNLMRSYHIGMKERDITAPQPEGDGAAPREMPVAGGSVQLIADKLRRGRTVEVLIGTDVVYAPPQEFLYKPHLRPALESNRDEVNAEARRAVQMMIKKAEQRA